MTVLPPSRNILKSSFIVTAALFAVFMLSVAGCESAPDRTALPGRRAAAKKVVKLKDKEGQLLIAGPGSRLPKAFPADLPLYKPSVVKSTIAGRDNNQPSMTMVILKTRSPVGEVVGFYQGALAAAGWSITNTVSLGQAATTHTIVKGEKNGTINIARDSGAKGTIISINIAGK